MIRAPYPARIAAGLLVTAFEETRKIPTLIFTLPMTAVSQTLQAGMRAQQNIAELAIKGDAALELLFEKPSEHPTWAHFDSDEIDSRDENGPESVATLPKAQTAPPPAPTAKAPAKKTPPPKAPAKKAPTAKKAATKAAATKKAAHKTAPTTAPTAPPTDTPTTGDPSTAGSGNGTGARVDAGRFALYSSAPDSVMPGATDTAKAASASTDGHAPEIVEYIEYDTLTLAQLRAKLRSVAAEDLTALSAYEKAGRNRAPFVTMIDNRIAAQNKRSPDA